MVFRVWGHIGQQVMRIGLFPFHVGFHTQRGADGNRAGPENKKTNGKCWRAAPNMTDQTQPEITESCDCGDYNSWNVLGGLWNSEGLSKR